MEGTQQLFVFVVLGMVAVVALVVGTMFMLIMRPWLRAFLHGAPVPAIHILAMRLRGNPPVLLIDAYIVLQRAGVPASIADVENAYIEGRNRISNSDDLVELVKKRFQA